jgi:hypothetical protein
VTVQNETAGEVRLVASSLHRSSTFIKEIMKHLARRFASVASLLLALAFSTGNALAQGTNGLVGAWVLVSADNVGAAGERTPTFGPNPRGSLILTSADRYSLHLSRDALPAFAAGSRVRGTPEEIQAVVAGSVAHFGRFAVSDKEINFHVETSTYPNWNGTLQKRTFTVVGDELKYSDAASSAGGRVELVWRRAK